MFFPLHVSFMAIATSALIAGVSAAIFFRKNKYWLKIHKSFNSFGLFGIAAGIIMAFFYVSGTDGKHIDGPHQINGLAAFILILITLMLGFYQSKAKNKLAVRTAHRLLGRFSLLLLLTTVTLGLILTGII
ncbi:MAG: hypothetical protein WB290_06250 [Smithella sp.]